MKRLILIGGKDKESIKLDKEIVKLANKDNPTFLFIGFASDYAEAEYNNIKKIYKSLNCNTTFLKRKNCINNKDLVIKKIKEADIIYIGGGNSIKLMDTLKDFEIDKLLKEAYNKGTLLTGISAGAICLSKEGFSDSLVTQDKPNNYKFIKGLGFTNISICPHYSDRKEILKKHLTNKTVYGLDNNTAIYIEDEEKHFIKDKNNNIYLIDNNKEEIL